MALYNPVLCKCSRRFSYIIHVYPVIQPPLCRAIIRLSIDKLLLNITAFIKLVNGYWSGVNVNRFISSMFYKVGVAGDFEYCGNLFDILCFWGSSGSGIYDKNKTFFFHNFCIVTCGTCTNLMTTFFLYLRIYARTYQLLRYSLIYYLSIIK